MMMAAAKDTSKLQVDVAAGDEIVLGGGVVIRIVKKNGPRTRMSIEAPRDVRITKVPAAPRNETD